MPLIKKVPLSSSSELKVVENKLTTWFSKEMWETIFPYYKASAVFTHDGEPFWRYEDLIGAIDWLNKHKNPVYHKFATEHTDNNINMIELASFLGNMQQETGEPSITAPYPWGWPAVLPKGEKWEGSAGGLLGILEGVIAEVYFGDKPPAYKTELASPPIKLSATEKKVLGVEDDYMGGSIRNLGQMNQLQFGMPNAGAVFQDNLVAVSQDGTLYGNAPENEIVGKVYPTSMIDRNDKTNPKFNSLSPVSQYGGRGAIQLSYNYNYTDCSLALFGDYRLVKYPNLIITTDRENFNNKPFYFGFPGPNIDGNNPLPQWIKDTTPSARQLAIITCLWFWMDRNRSGRTMSCHQCMLDPTKYGIAGCNLIINNQDGFAPMSWASKKIDYYRRVCKIMGINNYESTIVKPPKELYQ
jgi:hypothetical protein